MNPPLPSAPAAPRRSYGRWIAAGLIILAAPVCVLGIAAWSLLTLNRDASVLRREVMSASGSAWHTKVQLDLGGLTLGTVRTALGFVRHKDIEDARLALAAVRSASVGVYERDDAQHAVSAQKLFVQADELMRKRGWTRLVGVADDNQYVLIYSADRASGDRMDLCLAVIDGKELVVVSTQVEAEAVMKLVAKHAPEDFRKHIAKLTF